MSQTINTNISSLNAQRNLATSKRFAGDVAAASVLRACVSTRRRTTPPAWRSPTA